jgi:hypothetical protein
MDTTAVRVNHVIAEYTELRQRADDRINSVCIMPLFILIHGDDPVTIIISLYLVDGSSGVPSQGYVAT